MSRRRMTTNLPFFGFKETPFVRLYYLLCYRPKFTEYTSFEEYYRNSCVSEEKILQSLVNMFTLRLENLRREQETTLSL